MTQHLIIDGGSTAPPVCFLGTKDPFFWKFTRTRLFVLFTVLLGLVYANTFHASWQFDDKPNILSNHRIQITALSSEQILQSFDAKPGSGGFYRPVAFFTLALNWFCGQSDPFGYHVVNFLIHLASAWALFITILTLFHTPRLTENYTVYQRLFISGTATLLWALNPVQTQAVTYIVQRMASLASLFALLAVYAYLKARMTTDHRKRYLLFGLSLGSYLLGLLCKENVVLIPVVIPVLEVLFFNWKTSWRIPRKIAAGVALSIGICLAAGLLLRPDSIDFILHYYNNRPFTMFERLLTEQRILVFYLSLLFFPAPSRLSIEHDITLSTSLFSPWTTLAAICVNTLLILSAIKVARKQPLISLAILFFYLNHIVESTILPLELIFEHRNYLPSVFLFLPVAQGFNFLVTRFQHSRRLQVALTVSLSLVFVLEGYATFTRNGVWHSEQSLWLDALAKAPQSARPMATLAILLAWGENPTPAKYRKALDLTKRTLTLRMARNLEAEQLGNMASIYEKLGQLDESIIYYKKALAIAPEKVGNRYNYAKTLLSKGDFKHAHSELELILNQGAVHADYYQLLGFTDIWLGNFDRALPALRKALKLAPWRPDILLAIGNCLTSMGYHERAGWFFRIAERKGGHDVILSLNIIQNALMGGNSALARREFHRMLALFPISRINHMLEFSEKTYIMVPLDHRQLKTFLAYEMKHLQIFERDDSNP